MIRKTAFLVLAIALMALSVLGIGCGPEKGTPAIDLVPQRADFVADLDLYRIFSDPDVLNMINEIGAKLEEPKTVGEMVDQLKQETGIDLYDFSKILAFGTAELEDYFGAIVKGEFEEDSLIGIIDGRLSDRVSTTSYKGYELYLIAGEEEEVAVCLLDDYSIAVGATVAVEDVIDVKEGDTGLSGPVYDVYASLGEAWVKAAIEASEDIMGDIPLGDFPMPLEVFADIRAAGLSLDKSGQALSAQLSLYFTNSDSAAATGEALSSLMGLISFIPNVPPELTDILEELNVSVSDTWVTVSLETTVAEIESLIRGIELPIELPE